MKYLNLYRIKALALLASSTFVLTSVGYAEITYDFDDGTLQGWTTILPADPDTALLAFTATTAPVNNRVEPQAGTHLIAPMPWAVRQDAGPTLYLRSPEFFVDTSGDLTFSMAGGSGNANLPANDAEVLATPDTFSTGAMFVGLRRVSDGAFVLTKRRGGNGNPWVAHSFTAAELAPYVGELCTLDLVDSFVGGWGWTALDSVSIPGVTGASVVSSQSTFLTTVTAGDAVGDLATVGGTAGDTYSYALIAGEGSTDNDKFQLSGDQLQIGSFEFSSVADGTQYSVRLQSTGAPSGEIIETILNLTAETPYLPRLVGFWDFNEGNAATGAGGILDLASDDGGHDGTLTGGVFSTDVPTALAGAGSRSLDLTGGNGQVVIDTFSGSAQDDDFDAIKAQSMSVSVWVKGWPASNWVPFVAKNGEANGWQIRRQGGNNTGTFTLRGTTAADDPQTSSDIGPNLEWSHLVGTYDGITRRMFVNGVELITLADTGDITPTTDPVVFGNRILGGALQNSYSNVQLDDIGIWNYALSNEEIQSLVSGVSPVSGGTELAISAIEFLSPHSVQLTWDARANTNFTLNFSTDLIDWTGEIDDSIELGADDEVAGDGDQLTTTIDLSEHGLETQEKLFFRISR